MQYTTRDALMQIKAIIDAALVSPAVEKVALAEIQRIANYAMGHAIVSEQPPTR